MMGGSVKVESVFGEGSTFSVRIPFSTVEGARAIAWEKDQAASRQAAPRAIRALDRSDAGTIPILAMTANAFAEDAEKSRQAGMDAHIPKPLEIATVYATLGESLTRQKNDH